MGRTSHKAHVGTICGRDKRGELPELDVPAFGWESRGLT